jgi:hypothetical protein
MLLHNVALLPLILLLSGWLPLVPLPASAETTVPIQQEADAAVAEIARLSDALMMGDIVDVMRTEGIDYGTDLEDEMFPGRGGEDWARIVAAIYDPAEMRKRFDARLTEELRDAPEVVAQAMAFFTSTQGQRILKLEIEARRALADEEAEEAAKVVVEDMIANADPRMEVLRLFAETNELVEMNVTGALNANLAFYKGLEEGGAFGGEMTEDQMLSDVWSQEAEVRGQTEEWLFSFLALAYAPLSETDMSAYQAFSETAEGQRINQALFAAYEAVFFPISRELGLAAARQMQGEDI